MSESPARADPGRRLLSEISLRVAKNERVLVTTLTKRMAEDLTDYLNEHGVKVQYLHSDAPGTPFFMPKTPRSSPNSVAIQEWKW